MAATDSNPLWPATDGERVSGLEEAYAGEISACVNLLQVVQDVLTPWCGREWQGEVDSLVGGEVGRTIKTYRATLALCRAGFGEQAVMLTRSLFEGMLVTAWVSANPAEAVDLFEKHRRFSIARWQDTFDRWDAGGDVEFGEDVPPEEFVELQALFGRFGGKPWTARHTHAMVKEIRGYWVADPDELDGALNTLHRHANETLHSSSTSITAPIRGTNGDFLKIQVGPSSVFVAPALYSAYWCLARTMTVFCRHFDVPGEERVVDAFGRGHTAFVRLTDEQMTTPRNDPCPCGSGKKFKRCHGA